MKDTLGRNIDYLRISVTDRCNLRCVYCMPEEGIEPLRHQDILSYEEIVQLVEVAKSLGITHVRITGGEPLVRKGIVGLLGAIKRLGIEDLSMTTNGTLLAPMAQDLKKAGLDRVNISLDTLDPEVFIKITRRGHLEDVLQGMERAIEVGLLPVKINMVVMASLNLDQVTKMAELTLKYPIHARFIEVMPIGPDQLLAQKDWVPLKDIISEVEKLGHLEPASVKGAGPAQNMRLPSALGTVGFIGALSQPFCLSCNRLRLTAEGKLKPCLLSDVEVDVKSILRQEYPSYPRQKAPSQPLRGHEGSEGKAPRVTAFEQLQSAFRKAVLLKPKGHELSQGHPTTRRMCQIGG